MRKWVVGWVDNMKSSRETDEVVGVEEDEKEIEHQRSSSLAMCIVEGN